MICVSDKWKDYELLETGNGEKTERWGSYILRRPDPQCIWPYPVTSRVNPDGVYNRSNTGGGSWQWKKAVPERWQISYKQLKFYVEPTGFKHTGLFPEQAYNWDFLIEKIQKEYDDRDGRINVLNLFAYTGGATVACAYAGASVCHVDASKGMVSRAKENAQLSGLSDAKIRYIVDDAVKFVKREINRNSKYDIIIMDPPSYGRGPKGEMWQVEDSLYNLVDLCMHVLSDKPIAFMINSYASDISMTSIENILKLTIDMKYSGKTLSYELGLKQTDRKVTLPCGYTARWENK
ncbi:MAG: class I SAM-dependent methyltransferase [Clostridia bacterium]|jgi:23S rRNA (cytosine1962-C5)-methyltransferase|nr:class I SAM-dependent methyltransferase [Clostridia bacterium]